MQVVDFQARKKGIRKVPFSLKSGERGSQTYGFLEYHKIRKLMYVSRL